MKSYIRWRTSFFLYIIICISPLRVGAAPKNFIIRPKNSKSPQNNNNNSAYLVTTTALVQIVVVVLQKKKKNLLRTRARKVDLLYILQISWISSHIFFILRTLCVVLFLCMVHTFNQLDLTCLLHASFDHLCGWLHYLHIYTLHIGRCTSKKPLITLI